MHTGLLWGLELLAWSPELLPRVSMILAKLSRIDPGGRLINRPINSLGAIYLWWLPGTNATSVQKLAALDLILEREPEVGWSLLIQLLPQARESVAHYTERPRWRDVGDLPEDARTRDGRQIYVSAIVDRALDHIGIDPDRWEVVLDSLRVINTSQVSKALKLLEDIAYGNVSAEIRYALWKVLRDFINKNRTYSDAHWVLSSDLIDKLESILSQIAPEDPIMRYGWLFDEWSPALPSVNLDIETEAHSKRVEEFRQIAVKEIFRENDIGGLIRLGTNSRYPGFVANSILSVISDYDHILDLINQSIIEGKSGIILASQISGFSQKKFGEAWCEIVHKKAMAGIWSPAVIAALMIWWPDSRSTWEEIETFGAAVVDEYWCQKHVSLIEGNHDDQLYQIEHLIEAGRAAESFHRIAIHGIGIQSDILLKVFDATMEQLKKAKTKEEARQLGLSSHDIRDFLDHMKQCGDIPQHELARREYLVLPLLGLLNLKGLVIHELMLEDVDFFIEILCDVYLPHHRDKSMDEIPTDEQKARASAAYTILNSFHLIPGQQDENKIDESILLNWINMVRNKANERDRLVAADLKIGDILAHAPLDPQDHGWPHQIVRNIVEKLSNDDIERGIILERHNMRGVWTKDPYEGGKQERTLANQYRSWSEISRLHWPRMSQTLDKIAKEWDELAKREDARSEQEKLE